MPVLIASMGNKNLIHHHGVFSSDRVEWNEEAKKEVYLPYTIGDLCFQILKKRIDPPVSKKWRHNINILGEKMIIEMYNDSSLDEIPKMQAKVAELALKKVTAMHKKEPSEFNSQLVKIASDRWSFFLSKAKKKNGPDKMNPRASQ